VAEDYVRPPFLAVEPPSRRAAKWRFGVGLALVLLALAAGIVFGIRAIMGGGEGGATVGAATISAATISVASVTGPAGLAGPAGR
jgi:hypothetical protein